MQQALRSGISVADFWQMTPRETVATIEAVNWRDEQLFEQQVGMAWLNAALARQKRLQTLKSLLARMKQPKRPSQAELRERRAEFKQLAVPETIKRINEAMKKREQ